jgi:murein DD-endopeptidase MepM/ murein hydrolase activator NlpD
VRRIAVCLLTLFALATPALGDDIAKKHQIDAQLANQQAALAATRKSEAALLAKIAGLSNRIGSLDLQVGGVSQQLASLQQDLSLRRRRLTALTQLYGLQTLRLNSFKRQYALQLGVLNRRLVAIYEGDVPSTLDFVLGATSIDDALTKVDYINLVGEEDRQIASQVKRAKLAMAAERFQTKELRLKVLGDEQALAARAVQVQETKNALLGARDQIASAKQQQLVALSSLSAQDRVQAQEIDREQAVSNQLAQAIRAAQAGASQGAPATPSSAGLIWPVSGPVTSPFGMRWGRLHPGIDIGVPSGTPIHAAAAGTVIYCGWEQGYGNFVVLDNGGNLATAYAHQTSIAVTCGQHVDQGEVVGYSGCTGTCYGPHLHFEVRINGAPVDPMGYLP